MPEFTLPYRGINKGAVVDKQPQATSGYMNNIRPVDVLESRVRIGQRPGLDKWGNGDQIGGSAKPVVALASISSVSHRTGVLKDSFVGDYDNAAMINAANDRKAQNFVAGTSYNIASVKLPLTRSNSPGTVTAAIYAIDATTRKPTGSALATGTTDGDTLPTSSDTPRYEWREITFAAVYALTAGTEYTIVLSAASADESNAVSWWHDNSTTSPEERWLSEDGGTTWSQRPITSSLMYETYDNFSSYATSKRLIASGNDEVWYEDLSAAAGVMSELTAANGFTDTSDRLNMFEAFQKVVIVNGANLKIADFMNTVLDLGDANKMSIPPGRGDLLTQVGGATMLVDFVDSTKRYIYGYVTSGTFNTTGDITQTTQADDSLSAMSPNPITATLDDVTAKPHWYTYEVYPSISLAADGTKSYGTMTTKAYIGCLYRGRAVLSGNPEAPHQWYMSRQGNIWDFAYVANDAQSPVAGGNADAGEIGDIVTALIPYRDDYLIFGCVNSIWIMRGDPAAGGSLDELDLTVGMFGANSWCFDGAGNLYFFGTNGIYVIPAGFREVKNLTQFSLPKIIADEAIDASTHRITMTYDRIRMGLVICITNLSDGTNSNYWFDLKTRGFFPESYPDECGPYSLFYYGANDEDFRESLIGCKDGYIRKFDETAKDDDKGDTNKAISSYFTTIQPLGEEDTKGKLTSLTVTTAGGASGTTFGNTDKVSYEYHIGDDAETVLENMIDGATARESGTIDNTAATGVAPGRQKRIRKRARGHFLGLKFFNSADTETFAIEKVTGEIKPAGKN